MAIFARMAGVTLSFMSLGSSTLVSPPLVTDGAAYLARTSSGAWIVPVTSACPVLSALTISSQQERLAGESTRETSTMRPPVMIPPRAFPVTSRSITGRAMPTLNARRWPLRTIIWAVGSSTTPLIQCAPSPSRLTSTLTPEPAGMALWACITRRAGALASHALSAGPLNSGATIWSSVSTSGVVAFP